MTGFHLNNESKLMYEQFVLTDCYEFLWELVWSWASFGADDWRRARTNLINLLGSPKHLISSF